MLAWRIAMSTEASCQPTHRPFDPLAMTAVAVTVLAWSSSFPAIRAALVSFGAAELGALRFTIAAVPAALFLAVTRPALPKAGELWRFGYGGAFFVAAYTLFLNFGEVTVSAGAASFIINVAPIITAGLAIVTLGERFGPMAWLGTAVSFAGIGFIALGEGSGLSLNAGALLILGAAVCTATSTVVLKPLFARHGPLTVAAWNMVLGALLLGPFLPGALREAAQASGEALGSVLYLGLVPSLIAYATWAVALSRLPAARASNYLYCIPPLATLIGYLWLGETPGTFGIIGGLMALGGVVIVNLKR